MQYPCKIRNLGAVPGQGLGEIVIRRYRKLFTNEIYNFADANVYYAYTRIDGEYIYETVYDASHYVRLSQQFAPTKVKTRVDKTHRGILMKRLYKLKHPINKYQAKAVLEIDDKNMARGVGGGHVHKHTHRIFVLATDTKQEKRIDRHIKAF